MLRPVATFLVFGFLQFTVRYPSATLVLFATSRESSIADVIASIVLAVMASELVWHGALAYRDASALNHLREIIEKGGDVEMFRIEEYFPNIKIRYKYAILNISNYRTYAAIQYANYSSFIIAPFPPNAQNALRTFWLLHECGHIGPYNRAKSLHLETSKIVAMALMGPAVFLAFPGPWLLLFILIVGGYLAAVATVTGRLVAEVEADYFAFRAALDLNDVDTVLSLPKLVPPQDRKLDEDANRLRRASFDAMLKDVRSHRKLSEIHKYLQSESLLREIGTGLPLVIFSVCVGLFLPAHPTVTLVPLLFLLLTSLSFGILLRRRYIRARKVQRLVVERSRTKSPDPGGTILAHPVAT